MTNSPNIRLLFAIYEIIPHTEAVYECRLSRMGQTATKIRCALNDECLDVLSGMSHWKEQMKSQELDQIIDTCKSLREC